MDPDPELLADKRKPVYRRIAEGLREEIMSGRRAPGVQLPSTNDLAVQWKSSPYTIHTALTTLVKEGWLERLNGSGTFVIDPGKRFLRAGIYHAVDICGNEHPPFIRNVHAALLEKFKQRGKETQIFVDTRPRERQGQLLPALEKAIQERGIQCLVAPSLTAPSVPAVSRIKIPTAFLGHPESSHMIDSDLEDFFAKSVGHLAGLGCRSVAMISTIDPAVPDSYAVIYRIFEQTARRQGLATRPEWTRRMSLPVPETTHDQEAYAEFFRLWQLDDKPDGLIIYPDILVRGIATAVLELGIQVVPPRMKFVFHRNAHMAQFCPFPLTWAVSDENAWAEALIRVIEKQFSGEPISPVLIPFTLEENRLPSR